MNNTEKKGISLGYIVLGIILILAIILSINKIINKKEETITNNGESFINDSSTNFKVRDIKCQKGQEITVEIELLNDSDFVAANFEYKYDSNSLEYVNYEVGDSLKDGAMTIVNNDEDSEKILIGFVAKPEGNKLIKSGKLIDIKFKVKDNSAKNKIENLFESTTLKKEDGTDIRYNIQQGLIEIL